MYTAVDDIIALYRELTPEEITRAENLITVAEDALRIEANKVGKDLDYMIHNGDIFETVVKAVVVDIVSRTLNSNSKAEPVSNFSQSALGYTVSGTYLVPGGGTCQILRNDLKKLGLRRQKIGGIDLAKGYDC